MESIYFLHLWPHVLFRTTSCGRENLTLHYVPDFLFVPSPHGRPSSLVNYETASLYIEQPFDRLGLERLSEKGCWGSGVTRISHLGVIIDC